MKKCKNVNNHSNLVKKLWKNEKCLELLFIVM